MKRVIAYIDGYNLYYGLREKNWQRFYWLNLQKVAQVLLKPQQTLSETKYFTTIVANPPDRRRRHSPPIVTWWGQSELYGACSPRNGSSLLSRPSATQVH